MSKIKPINSKLLNLDKSTSTFMYLMSKYRKQKRGDKNNDKMHIAQAIDKKRLELEIEEKDNMYIYKEAKNIAYINQELINEFGKKAKSQSHDLSKYSTPIKLYKQQFFDPTKDNYLQNNIFKKLNYKGIVKLPLITDYYYNKNKPLLTYSNSNMPKIKINKQFKNTQTIPNNNNEDYSFDSNINLNVFTPKKIKNFDLSTITKTSICPSTIRNSESDKNLLISDLLNKDIQSNNNFGERKKYLYYSNRNIFANNGAYLTRLSNFKEQLVKQEKKKRNYFNRNDYGCKLFKEQYDFLNKKYFE